jgi:hypothetical protein
MTMTIITHDLCEVKKNEIETIRVIQDPLFNGFGLDFPLYEIEKKAN